jgi:TRAP-type transport system periplasmic protein
MRNRLFAVVLVVLLFASASLFAGGDAEGGGTQVINVASTFPGGSPQDQGLNRFKELVEEGSDGRFDVIIHTGGAMGDERETFEMLSAGEVEFGAVGSNDISTFYPEYAVSEVPYIFSSVDQFWAYWNGPLGEEIHDLIEAERGVRTLGVVLRGARYLTADRPVRSVEEVQGLRLRLPQVGSWFAVWEHLGALPQPVNFSEVYLALQTGTVEAQENPPETILNYKFYEVQDYLIQTEHIYSAARFQMSMDWFNSLSPEDQGLITVSMQEATDFANSLTENGDAEFVRILVEDHGMELIEVDQDAFKEAVQPVLEELAREDWKPGLYEQLQDL